MVAKDAKIAHAICRCAAVVATAGTVPSNYSLRLYRQPEVGLGQQDSASDSLIVLYHDTVGFHGAESHVAMWHVVSWSDPEGY